MATRRRAYALATLLCLGVVSSAWGVDQTTSYRTVAESEWRDERAREAYERERQEAHTRIRALGQDTLYASSRTPAATVPVHPPPLRMLHGVANARTGPRRATQDQGAFAERESVTHSVPLFPRAADAVRQGFVRVINHSSLAGEIVIDAIDDTGIRFGPVSLLIDPRETIHFNSGDLESGNPDKGLAGGIGSGAGDWRLEISSELDVEVLAFIRTSDGFLTAMHDVVSARGGVNRVAIFNPASNVNQVSRLRVINTGDDRAEITVVGMDDSGRSPGGAAKFSVREGASRTVAARELELGEGISGAIGDGTGKWQLEVTAADAVQVMSLLDSPSGHLTNLSTGSDLMSSAGVWHVPLFPAMSDASGRQGFVRVINHGDVAGEVTIRAQDDTDRRYEPITLAIGGNRTINFNSEDLEVGNDDKGIAVGVGAGQGDWRLVLETRLDVEVLAYIRTADGFLTAMHDLVTAVNARHRVAVFNPASNVNQISKLRLINPGGEATTVTVSGIDGRGRSPGSSVTISLPAASARTLTAQDLESGADDFDGALGDGVGKWRLLVESELPIRVMNLLESPTGHLTNLSSAGSRYEETATEDLFAEWISSQVVQNRCVNCHVEGGLSGNTRLVFVGSSNPDHESVNLRAFEAFVAEVEDGGDLILNKIQGVDHGGGIQVSAGSEDFERMREFLGRLTGDVGGTVAAVTATSLFDTVRMESARRTLYRAALIFAGRLPDPAELASLQGGTTKQLRDTIRSMMTGPAFHEFLVRGANDRLLTDSLLDVAVIDAFQSGVIAGDDGARYLDFVAKRNRLRQAAEESGDYTEYHRWLRAVRHGVRQAPVELIAYVAENDLPYTDVLTADYIMANPPAAEAYGFETSFDDVDNAHEFRPVRITNYRRYGVTMEDYPHAGVLNTPSYLRRYPTTSTNRNRARSRWTYYHFLGFDIQNAAPTVIGAEALLDTRNPTMHNPACAVCHIPLDPVAGAFQNYTDVGHYRGTVDGLHALDYSYTAPWGFSKRTVVEPATWGKRQAVAELGVPMTTESLAVFRLYDFNRDQVLDGNLTRATIRLGPANLRDRDYRGRMYPVDFEQAYFYSREGYDYGRPDLERLDETGDLVARIVGNRTLAVPVEIPGDARYDIEAEVWAEDTGEVGELSMSALLFRPGDLWYRDMRSPGFDGMSVPDADNSLQWLAERMAADSRFAEGAVKFWWPSIMGREVALPPGEDDPEFESRLLAASAQSLEVARLARGFRGGFYDGDEEYNLKDLLAAIAMSQWFRADRVAPGEPLRDAALVDAGARRVLTPEELASKTASVTGFQWGRTRSLSNSRIHEPAYSALTDPEGYELLYGGIDSDAKTVRSRDMTAMMGSVAKVHAARSSCPIVLREFYLLDADKRRLFGGFDTSSSPDDATGSEAIRDQLVELHRKLFGIDVEANSPDVDAAFGLFKDTLQRKRRSFPQSVAFAGGNDCDTSSDVLFLQDIVDPPIVVEEGDGYRYYVQNDEEGLLARDHEDREYLARTWVVVLAYLLMDYRYLYL